MGSSKKQTVSYWYHPTFQMVLHEGPFDKLLEIRGGDVTAWKGEMTASGSIQIDAANIWGGEEKEGGIQGTVDVSFGEMDAQPNAYFQTAIGADPSGHNGYALLQFNGGRYGAGNPYPKPISVLTERIYEGWLGDECWYPERAKVFVARGEHRFFAVPIVGNNGKVLAGTTHLNIADEIDTGLPHIDLFKGVGPALYAFDGAGNGRVSLDRGRTWSVVTGLPSGSLVDIDYSEGVWVAAAASGQYAYRSTNGVAFSPILISSSPRGWFGVRGRQSTWFIGSTVHGYARSTDGAMSFAMHQVTKAGGGTIFNGPGAPGVAVVIPVQGGWLAAGTGEYSAFSATGVSETWVAVPNSINDGAGSMAAITLPDRVLFVRSNRAAIFDSIPGPATRIDDLSGSIAQNRNIAHDVNDSIVLVGLDNGIQMLSSESWVDVPMPGTSNGYLVAILQRGERDLYGMNPAHVLYDSLTCLQGEPAGTIDVASFRRAADILYAEGFGICTRYDHDRETIEQFRQRILDLIGAECSRYTGRWFLDLIRPLSQGEISALPVLSDDDILEWEEDHSTLDDTVNQVSVRWFDPQTKSARVTAPVHALASINAMGGINAELKDYPEVPYEDLATRIAARDLQNKSTPIQRLRLTANRRPYSWRKGQPFRLQAPRRGIADMVCRVAEIDRGSLQSGAIRLVVVQDVFAMPDTAYVVGQTPVLPPRQTPEEIEHGVLVEAPYVELAGVLGTGDLAALDTDAGYVLAAAARPGNGQSYALLTRSSGGEFVRAGLFDWCPSATINEVSGYTDTEFTLADGSYLERVEIGSAALWGSEIVRVDALDRTTGVVVLGRGCGDTVAVAHAAGERIYFYDAWSASDGVEYVTGEVVEAKLLPRTGTQELAPDDAAILSVTMGQRASRPYPPGKFRINGEVAPEGAGSEVEISWAHRDRIAQADQLIDAEVGSVGPEEGTTYTMRAFLNDLLDDEQVGIDGTTAIWTPSQGGIARVEVVAVRDGLESWQAQVREFPIDLYHYAVFTSSGTWDWEAAGSPAEVDVLLVGGGGGGGSRQGGGGGAGGVRVVTGITVSGDVPVTVGAGGAGGTSGGRGSNGGDSSFGAEVAIGGGGGGGRSADHDGLSGGSGGGGAGARDGSTPSSTTGGSGTAGQGNAGGNVTNGGRNFVGGGGGGGAAGAGANVDGSAASSNPAANGGNGVTLDSFGWGEAVGLGAPPAVGGGGGGGRNSWGSGGPGTGGIGGGGAGSKTGPGESGTPNTGGGGGGSFRDSDAGGAGGSGLVVVRWKSQPSENPDPE